MWPFVHNTKVDPCGVPCVPRARAGRRVPRPGHEDGGGGAAAGHPGGHQPQVHAQPGERPPRERGYGPPHRHEEVVLLIVQTP